MRSVQVGEFADLFGCEVRRSSTGALENFVSRDPDGRTCAVRREDQAEADAAFARYVNGDLAKVGGVAGKASRVDSCLRHGHDNIIDEFPRPVRGFPDDDGDLPARGVRFVVQDGPDVFCLCLRHVAVNLFVRHSDILDGQADPLGNGFGAWGH